jgi:dermatan 4-sulfotransferase 1
LNLRLKSPTQTEQIQQLRKRHLSAACARLLEIQPQLAKLQPHWKEIYVDDDRRYVYCLISKASCTSWKRTLLWITGKVQYRYERLEDLPTGYIHNYFYNDLILKRMINMGLLDRQRRLRGRAYFRFAFFRDPIDRLMSAYRDKIIADPTYKDKFNSYIISRYRQSNHSFLPSNEAPPNSRKSSVQISIDSSPESFAATSSTSDATFAEFVQYILDQRSMGAILDRHWRPQYELCNPCVVNYDFIGHQETLHPDAEYVLDILRRRTPPSSSQSTSVDVDFPTVDVPRLYSGHGHSQPAPQRTNHSIRDNDDLLSQLTDDNLRKIVELYDIDYELFGFQRPPRALNAGSC